MHTINEPKLQHMQRWSSCGAAFTAKPAASRRWKHCIMSCLHVTEHSGGLHHWLNCNLLQFDNRTKPYRDLNFILINCAVFLFYIKPTLLLLSPLIHSGRVEAFNGLLSAVRMRGLRGDPLLRDTETLIDRYHSLGILFENQVQILKTLDGQIETFQTNAKQIRAWIRNLKQELEYLGTDTPTQEKHINTQVGPLTLIVWIF